MPDPVEVRQVDPDQLDQVWDRVTRTLNWGGVRGELALPALRNLVRIAFADLWVAPDWRFPSRLSSVIVSTIIQRPRKAPCLRIEFLSGRHIGTWIESAARTLSRHARVHGCTHLEFVGRIGWRQYRTLFDLPGTWLIEERAAGRCQRRKPTALKPVKAPISRASGKTRSGAVPWTPPGSSSGPVEISRSPRSTKET